MTESFKQQLQELINQAAKEYQADENRPKLGPANSFKQGCEFLIPMIESLVEMRNHRHPKHVEQALKLINKPTKGDK